jgi:hypothetical protein
MTARNFTASNRRPIVEVVLLVVAVVICAAIDFCGGGHG